MRLSALCLTLTRILTNLALGLTLWLYMYPASLNCSFPPPKHLDASSIVDDQNGKAPFRLLALADPQLEGDTSIPTGSADDGLFPSLREAFWHGVQSCGPTPRVWCGLRPALAGLLVHDLPHLVRVYQKKVDLRGNDLYLAHIYRTMKWWTAPTHVVVLGDLLGSQWIGDEEFERRRERFWGTVFRGAEKVGREVTDVEGRVEVLGADTRWERRVIAVAGNHDIGYAGDIDGARIERFEEAFGAVNWAITFRLNVSISSPSSPTEEGDEEQAAPELRLIILNSMNLDSPAYSPDHQQQSLDFLARQLDVANNENFSDEHWRARATILLTHIPLHKPSGVCVDAPYFSYFPDDQGGGIQEQNHLSEEGSRYILDGLVESAGGRVIVLNGHDHEGCNVVHYWQPRAGEEKNDNVEKNEEREEGGEADEATDPLINESPEAQAADTVAASSPPGFWTSRPFAEGRDPRNSSHHSLSSFVTVPEVTVRSMMGAYSGNAGLLSAWWDPSQQSWAFEFRNCALGVQHIWWAVHILDVVVVGLWVGVAVWRGGRRRDTRLRGLLKEKGG